MTLETPKDKNEKEVLDRPDDQGTVIDRSIVIRDRLLSFVGVFIVLIAIVVMFLIASLDGVREVKASRNLAGKIIQDWRTANGLGIDTFPEELVERFTYSGKEYYFVVDDYDDEGVPVKWYFAYEGEIKYIFSDWKFWALNAIALVLSIYIASTMFKTGVNSSRKSEKFKQSVRYYSNCKTKVEADIQHIPAFCTFKFEEAYNVAVQRMCKQASIKYEDYKKNPKLRNYQWWQRRILRKIKKIRVEPISQGDLLQDRVTHSLTKISILPISQEAFERRYVIKTAVSRTLSIMMSGLTVAFGFSIGNWQVGISYALIILSTAFSAFIVGIDYGTNQLRLRYVGKGDLLTEFSNTKSKYEMLAKAEEEAKKKAEEPKAKQQIQPFAQKVDQVVTSIPQLQEKQKPAETPAQTSFYLIP